MAVAFQSQSTVSLGARTNTTFTAPSGITNGDLLVIVMTVGDNPAQTATGPTGFAMMSNFVQTYGDDSDPSYDVRIHAWSKVASGESGNYTVTHSAADTEGIIMRLNGQAASPINPTPVATMHASGTGGAALIAPSITPVVDNSLIIWAGGTWDAFGAASPPTGTTPTFTERMNDSTGIFYCATGVLATAGATGTKTVTSTQADNRAWGAVMICIEAAPAGLIGKNIVRSFARTRAASY